MRHNCDLCGGDESTPIEAARPYIGGNEPPEVCGNCGFVLVRNRRTPEEIAAEWSNIFGEGYSSEWPAVKARLTYVAEWIDQTIILDRKSVLDIGAGQGEFLRIAGRMGADIAGIEPSAENIKRLRADRISCYHGTAESVDLDEKFDIVTVLWTLENTGDCIGFLKKARTFLKPDGHLVVATGSRILVPFRKPLSKYFSTNPADTHCFRFSANSLHRALEQAGMFWRGENRWDDCDWLLMAAHMDEFNRTKIAYPRDNPKAVLKFFNSWQKMWP